MDVGEALKRQRVAALLESGTAQVGQEVLINGWVRTVRSQKTFSFVEVNDGSSLGGVQARPLLAPTPLPGARGTSTHRMLAAW